MIYSRLLINLYCLLQLIKSSFSAKKITYRGKVITYMVSRGCMQDLITGYYYPLYLKQLLVRYGLTI